MTPKQRRRACMSMAYKTYRAHFAPLFIASLLLWAADLLVTAVFHKVLPAPLPYRAARAIPFIRKLASLLVTAPLQVGLYDLCLRFLKEQGGGITHLLLWFRDGVRLKASLRGQLYYAFTVFFPFLGLLLAGILFISILSYLFQSWSYFVGTPFVGLVLLGVLAVSAVIGMRRLFGVFSLAEQPEGSAIQLSGQGMEQSAPYQKELLCLLINLLPLALPSLILSYLSSIPGLALATPLARLLLLLASTVCIRLLVPYLALNLAQFYRMTAIRAKRTGKGK